MADFPWGYLLVTEISSHFLLPEIMLLHKQNTCVKSQGFAGLIRDGTGLPPLTSYS